MTAIASMNPNSPSAQEILLESALKRCRFNQRATAHALKLSYDQLRHALRRHDLLDRQA